MKNERQAYLKLAKQAGAAQVARMPDGTLACSGRDGQLAEPVEYDDCSDSFEWSTYVQDRNP